MAIAVYPSYLPGFLQSGYSLKTQPNMLRTQMSDGYTRQRVINSGKPAELSVSMSMSGAEYNAFMSWINKNAAGGAGWFMAPVLSSETGDKEPQYQTVRIQNGAISAALTWRSETGGGIKYGYCGLPVISAGVFTVRVQPENPAEHAQNTDV